MFAVQTSMNQRDGSKFYRPIKLIPPRALIMSRSEIPAMPDPNSRPKKKADPAPLVESVVTPSPHITKEVPPAETTVDKAAEKAEEPIRLKPTLKQKSDSPSSGYPIRLKSKPSSEEKDEDQSKITNPIEPIANEASWNDNLLQSNKDPSKLSKFIFPTTIALSICMVGLIIWALTKEDSSSTNTLQNNGTASTGPKVSAKPEWEATTRKVLADYLDAEAQGNLDERLRLVTQSRETQVQLPKYKPRHNSADVVEASSFVAKPLPTSFTDHGIYLMYYQRPNTLPEDSVFRPIVPIRVRLAIDSPSFLELAAKSGYLQTRNRQNICAFFKRNKDNSFTLDWPVFVQTRHRLLEKFTHAPHTEARQVFRLMVYKVQPTLIDNVYNAHLPNHDWYRIHCPGYIQETHVVAVSKESAAGQIMTRQFKNSVAHRDGVQALTAELSWHVSKKDGSPVLGISGIVSWEFYNLNSPEVVKPTNK